MNQIDLGRKYPTCEPSPMDVKSKDEPKISYPSLYLDDIEGLGDLPEGIFNLIGKAKVIRRTKTERDGKVQHSVELEIHSIEAETPEEDAKETESDEDVIDEGLKAAEAEVSKE